MQKFQFCCDRIAVSVQKTHSGATRIENKRKSDHNDINQCVSRWMDDVTSGGSQWISADSIEANQVQSQFQALDSVAQSHITSLCCCSSSNRNNTPAMRTKVSELTRIVEQQLIDILLTSPRDEVMIILHRLVQVEFVCAQESQRFVFKVQCAFCCQLLSRHALN